MHGVYLNLGCGNTAPDSWINCDSSLHAQISKIPLLHRVAAKAGITGAAEWPRNVRFISLARPFPWADASADCVYASHVFEHLSPRVCDHFMSEAFRVLKPGGAIRLVVPDLYEHASRYVAAGTGARDFLYVVNMQVPDERNLIRRLYGAVMGHPHVHKYMYDEVTLREIFVQHGFRNIRRASYGESAYVAPIGDVEARAQGYDGSLYLEATKPLRADEPLNAADATPRGGTQESVRAMAASQP